jgi:hypothetical protein
MDRALDQLRGLGVTVNDEDVARLSPLGTNHINVLGRYHFSLPDAIARGEFRPLRDPSDFDDDDLLIQQAASEDLGRIFPFPRNRTPGWVVRRRAD